MLDFRCADAVRERAERAVRGGVAVTADDGGAGQRETLLRPDDVDDALALVELVVILDAEVGGVLGERLDLDAAVVVGDAVGAVRGRHVVVDDGERLFRRADLAAGHAQSLEGLRACDLVDQVAVDVEDAGAVFGALDDVVLEDLVVKRGGGGAGHFSRRLLFKLRWFMGRLRCELNSGWWPGFAVAVKRALGRRVWPLDSDLTAPVQMRRGWCCGLRRGGGKRACWWPLRN